MADAYENNEDISEESFITCHTAYLRGLIKESDLCNPCIYYQGLLPKRKEQNEMGKKYQCIEASTYSVEEIKAAVPHSIPRKRQSIERLTTTIIDNNQTSTKRVASKQSMPSSSVMATINNNNNNNSLKQNESFESVFRANYKLQIQLKEAESKTQEIPNDKQTSTNRFASKTFMPSSSVMTTIDNIKNAKKQNESFEILYRANYKLQIQLKDAENRTQGMPKKKEDEENNTLNGAQPRKKQSIERHPTMIIDDKQTSTKRIGSKNLMPSSSVMAAINNNKKQKESFESLYRANYELQSQLKDAESKTQEMSKKKEDEEANAKKQKETFDILFNSNNCTLRNQLKNAGSKTEEILKKKNEEISHLIKAIAAKDRKIAGDKIHQDERDKISDILKSAEAKDAEIHRLKKLLEKRDIEIALATRNAQSYYSQLLWFHQGGNLNHYYPNNQHPYYYPNNQHPNHSQARNETVTNADQQKPLTYLPGVSYPI